MPVLWQKSKPNSWKWTLNWKQNISFWSRFERWHFLESQVVLIKFISGFFCWDNFWSILPDRQRQRIWFPQKNVFANIFSLSDVSKNISRFIFYCEQKYCCVLFGCFFRESRLLIEIEQEMLGLIAGHFIKERAGGKRKSGKKEKGWGKSNSGEKRERVGKKRERVGKQVRKPRSYASLKLRLTDWLTCKLTYWRG